MATLSRLGGRPDDPMFGGGNFAGGGLGFDLTGGQTGGAEANPFLAKTPKGPALGGAQPTGGFAQTFDQLWNVNPALAYQWTGGGGNAQASQWYQQNQNALRDQYFGGDMGKWNQWVNDSAYGANNVLADPNMSAQYMAITRGGNPLTGQPATSAQPARPRTGGAEPMPGMVDSPAMGSLTPGQVEAGSMAPLSSLAGSNYGIDVNKFLSPAMDFRIKAATDAVQNSAAARGGLLSGATLQGVSDRANQVAAQEWDAAFNRADADRRFAYGVDDADRRFMYDVARDDRNFKYDVDRYNTDMAYRAAVDNRNFDWAAQRDARDFQYGVDRDNRNFDYQAQFGDREFDYRRLSDLARLGLAGSQGQTGLQQTLANLLNQNILAGGNAQAGGTVGGSNAFNQMISQLLQQFQNNQTLGLLGG